MKRFARAPKVSARHRILLRVNGRIQSVALDY